MDVLVFPELFLHGYDATKDQLEATALRRDELGACAAAAEAHALCLAVPYCERRGSSLYNAMAVFDARGALAKNYRKVNLWGAWERDVFSPGAPGSFEPFDLETRSLTVRAGCLICFDVEFPEPARHLAVAGAELLLAPTALGAGPVDDLTPRKVVPTRALENHQQISTSSLARLANLLLLELSLHESAKRSSMSTAKPSKTTVLARGVTPLGPCSTVESVK